MMNKCPGDHIREELRFRHWTQGHLAELLGISRHLINLIINGKHTITLNTAEKLSNVLGTSTTFWLNLEENYKKISK
jgi:addiction module HigA family antidote